MATKPTDDVSWSTSGSASPISEPLSSIRAAGFPSGYVPPAAWVNWIQRAVGRWITYLAATLSSYSDLEEALDEVAVGDTFLLDGSDVSSEPWIKVAGDSGPSYDLDLVAAYGSGVIAARADSPNPQAFDRSPQQIVGQYVKTNVAATTAIAADPRYVVVAAGQYVEAFNRATNASLWVYDHGATVYDVTFDGDRVYLVGELGTGNKHARALNLSTGAAVWSYRHTATGGDELRAVATDGRRVYVAGHASSYASGATVRCLAAATGNDATNEGGTAADTSGLAWNNAALAATIPSGGLATDGRALYLSDGTTVNAFKKVDAQDGATLSSQDVPATGAAGRIAVDHDFMYGVYTNGSAVSTLYVMHKSDLRTVATWQAVISGTAREIFDVDSDGERVFVVSEYVASQDNIHRIRRDNRPRMCRRVSDTDKYRPYRSPYITAE